MNIYKNSDYNDDCSNHCNCSKDCADHIYCAPRQIPLPVPGPTGATGIIPPDSSAFFASFGLPYANGSLIPYGEVVSDPTGQITLADATHIALSPGDYLVSYHVSALLRTAGYMQVTPFFNGSSHLEFGIYFKTTGDQSSGYGSQSILVSVPDQTLFSLTFNSNSISTDGTATITFLRLNRPA